MRVAKKAINKRKAGAKNQAKVSKSMTIGELIRKYPKTVFVFLDYGLHCVGCPMSLPETVEEAAKVHGIDLKKFIRDLEKAIK